METVRRSLLSATTNTRDLGGYPAADGRETLRNRVWRSDAPTARTAEDEALLRSLDITTVIDLRTDAEAAKGPCAYADVSGFAYRRFPITAGSVPPATLEEVPASYLEIATQPEMTDALRTAAEAGGGVLFCCTAGKDRTGVLAALLLLACGADRRDITDDYAVSREYNRLRLERYLAEHPEVDRRVVLANEISMERFLDLLGERFGGIEGYFERQGPGREALALIRRKLLG